MDSITAAHRAFILDFINFLRSRFLPNTISTAPLTADTTTSYSPKVAPRPITFRKGERLCIGNDIITVLAGDTEQPFAVHEGLIVKQSVFFQVACNGRFKERDRTVRLPTIDAATLEEFLNWLYTGSISTPDESVVGSKEEKEECGTRYVQLSKLYVAADFLDAVALRNIVIDTIIDWEIKKHYLPSPKAICIAYRNTPEHSRLRALFLDMYLGCASQENQAWLKRHRKELPSGFIFDLAHSRMAVTGQFKWKHKRTTKCTWHEHIEGDPKCT